MVNDVSFTEEEFHNIMEYEKPFLNVNGVIYTAENVLNLANYAKNLEAKLDFLRTELSNISGDVE